METSNFATLREFFLAYIQNNKFWQIQKMLFLQFH